MFFLEKNTRWCLRFFRLLSRQGLGFSPPEPLATRGKGLGFSLPDHSSIGDEGWGSPLPNHWLMGERGWGSPSRTISTWGNRTFGEWGNGLGLYLPDHSRVGKEMGCLNILSRKE